MFFLWGFPCGASGKEPACQCRRCKRHGFYPWDGKIPWRKKWQPTPVFLHGKFHGQRSLMGYSPWGCKESDTTEHALIHTHTHRNVLLCWFWGNHKFSGFPLIFFSDLWTSFSPLLECSRMWLLGLFSLLYLHSVNSLSPLALLLQISETRKLSSIYLQGDHLLSSWVVAIGLFDITLWVSNYLKIKMPKTELLIFPSKPVSIIVLHPSGLFINNYFI